MPNGLRGFSKVPAIDWCQSVPFTVLIELGIYYNQTYGLALGYLFCIIPELCLLVTDMAATAATSLTITLGFRFVDFRTGLAAFWRVPAVGRLQWVAFCCHMGLFVVYQGPALTPGELTSRFVVGLTTVNFNNLSGWVFGLFGTLNVLSMAVPRLRKMCAGTANGRVEMMASFGMSSRVDLTGTSWGDLALCTDAPRRAYVNGAEVQAPGNSRDQLGLAASDSTLVYDRRAIKMKHVPDSIWRERCALELWGHRIRPGCFRRHRPSCPAEESGRLPGLRLRHNTGR